MSLKKLMISLLLMSLGATAAAADLAREKRIAAQIKDAVFDGEVMYLKDGDHDFMGIHQRTTADKPLGAALILHGRGANPDWIDVVQPLRIGLAEHGWDTLSIQLPVAREAADDREWAALVAEAAPRIQAALDHLDQNSEGDLVIVAHSFGSRMAAAYLADKQPARVKAFVAIGMSADPAQPDSGNLAALRKIAIPVYDLYGERDLPQVLNSVRQRQLAARDAGNANYRQTQVAGADHFFSGNDELLVSTVRAWLNRQATGGRQE